jgi:hypothetical protein
MTTNSVAMYRPNSRWQIVAAFTAAATIHLSALAIAALHHEAPAISPEERFADIDVYNNIALPATNPETAGLCSNSAAGTNATSWFEESKRFCPECAAT